MTRRARPEEALHLATAQYLRLALPRDAVWHHSPNEAKAKVQWHAKRKALGMRAGWPDLEFVWQGRAMFIELKAPKGRLNDNQEKARDDLVAAGALVALCRSVEAVEITLRTWGVPLKARAA